MDPLTADEIRASFVNCTKGESKRLPLPKSLDSLPWAHYDFLGWRDPGNPGAAYLVAPHHGGPVGCVLRISTSRRSSGRSNLCAICLTAHSTSDVALMVAPRAGAAGRAGNTVGTYLCADLACSLFVRGLQRPHRVQPPETLSVDEKIKRLWLNLDAFVNRVLGD